MSKGNEAWHYAHNRSPTQERQTTNDLAVLAVFHDADNDGDVDAYVSSSVERVEDDRYRWHLYLNGKDGFIREPTEILTGTRKM